MLLKGTFSTTTITTAPLRKHNERARVHYFLKKEEKRNRRWHSSSSSVSSSLRRVEERVRVKKLHRKPLGGAGRTPKASTNDLVFSVSDDDDNNKREEGKRKVMYDFCVTYPWAIMVAGSGVAGFVLKRSIPSLASGLVLGALLFLFANKSLQQWQENRQTRIYTFLSLCLTALLMGIMAPKYILRNGAFFPSGMLTIGGGIVCVYYIILLLVGGNAALGKKNKKQE